MTNRTEYCALNNLDDTRESIAQTQTELEAAVGALRSALKAIQPESGDNGETVTIDYDTWKELDDELDNIEGCKDDLETDCTNLDDEIDSANEIARETLESLEEDSKEKGADECREECQEYVNDSLPELFESVVGGLDAKCDDPIGYAIRFNEFVADCDVDLSRSSIAEGRRWSGSSG